MTRESFPEIPASALKGHASPERVARVWRRLELDLVARRPRPVFASWGLVAAAAGLFGVGVLVGVQLRSPSAPDVAAEATPVSVARALGAGAEVLPSPLPTEPRQPGKPKATRARRPVGTPQSAAEAYTMAYGPVAVAAPREPTSASDVAEWEELAEAGDFRAARDALDRAGGFERAAARASASQLLVLADVARASGSREQAAQALRRVLSAYVSAPEAPLAAWTLGNLLDQAGDRAGAAEAYATYRRLSPAGDFAEDAAARQVDAALSQEDLELGRRALEEYARNFPKGRRLAELRERLATLAAPSAAAEPVAPESSDPDDDDDDAAERGADSRVTPADPAHED